MPTDPNWLPIISFMIGISLITAGNLVDTLYCNWYLELTHTQANFALPPLATSVSPISVRSVFVKLPRRVSISSTTILEIEYLEVNTYPLFTNLYSCLYRHFHIVNSPLLLYLDKISSFREHPAPTVAKSKFATPPAVRVYSSRMAVVEPDGWVSNWLGKTITWKTWKIDFDRPGRHWIVLELSRSFLTRISDNLNTSSKYVFEIYVYGINSAKIKRITYLAMILVRLGYLLIGAGVIVLMILIVLT